MSTHSTIVDLYLHKGAQGDSITIPLSLFEKLIIDKKTPTAKLFSKLLDKIDMDALDIQLIKELVELGLPEDTKFWDCNMEITMLDYYAKYGEHYILEYLIGLIPKQDFKTRVSTALKICLDSFSEINKPCIALLLKSLYEDYKNPELISFLVKLLMVPGYELTQDFSKNLYPCIDEFTPQLLEIFVKAVASVDNFLDPNGKSILYHYAELGKLENVEKLLNMFPRKLFGIKTGSGKCLSERILSMIENDDLSESKLEIYKKIYKLVRDH